FSKFSVVTGRQRLAKDPNNVFTLREGELLVSGVEPGFLITRQSFTNYRLTAEYRWDTDAPDRDSGIFVNTVESDNEYTSLECNLLGPGKGQSGQLQLFGRGRKQLIVSGQTKKQGAVLSQQPKSAEKPVGQWNTMEVVNDLGQFEIKVNGKLTIAGLAPQPSAGSIMLQSNRGAIRFRNVKVVDYDAATANALELVRKGQLSDAARLIDDFLKKEPPAFGSMRGLRLAALYAATGNREAHELYCQTFFEKFASPRYLHDVSRTAKAYALFPGAQDPKLLARALAASKHSTDAAPQSIWFSVTRGMVEYRLGNYENVVRWLTKPARTGNKMALTPALAFAAMAEFRLGRPQRARQLLNKAETVLGQIGANHESWHDAISAKLAVDEAKALIK
ncbi:MAG: hypothetical protein ACI8W8_005026, partial [Rhodothermales bacterium]